MLFSCLFFDTSGSLKKIRICCASPQDAEQQITGQAKSIVYIKPAYWHATIIKFSIWIHRICNKNPKGHLIIFTKALHKLIKHGVTVKDGLTSITNKTTNPLLLRHYKAILNDITQGIPLHKSLSQHHELFPDFYCNMIAAGETSCSLDKQLQHLEVYLTKKQALLRAIKKSLSYPTYILSTAAILIFALLYFVVPKLAEISPHNQHSATSRLNSISLFLHQHILSMVTSLLVMVLCTFILRKSSKLCGNSNKLTILLFIRPIKTIILLLEKFQWAYQLSISMRCNNNLAACLEKCALCALTAPTGNKFQMIYHQVSAGQAFYLAAEATNIFTQDEIMLMKISEHTNNLAGTLQEISDDLQEYLTIKIETYVTRLQPILLLLSGIIVAAIVAAVYLPLLQIGNTL